MIAEKPGNHARLPRLDSFLKWHCPESPQTSGQLCFQHDTSTLARQRSVVAELRCPCGYGYIGGSKKENAL